MQDPGCNYHLPDDAVDQANRFFGHITAPRPEPAPWSTVSIQLRGSCTLEECAQVLGCTRERVRQIEMMPCGSAGSGVTETAAGWRICCRGCDRPGV